MWRIPDKIIQNSQFFTVKALHPKLPIDLVYFGENIVLSNLHITTFLYKKTLEGLFDTEKRKII